MLSLFLQTATTGPDLFGQLAPLGVGGILAGIVLVFYRADRKASEDRLTDLAKDFRTIIQDNTKAMQSVADAVDKMGR